MKRFQILLALAFALALPANVFGHGGSFKGPPGGVPPGLRPASDPEPPPPPPSDPNEPTGPVTPNEDPQGPVTPDDIEGPTSGKGGTTPMEPTKPGITGLRI